jgi:LAS superfamily LD-carboxypeptidase LdcB
VSGSYPLASDGDARHTLFSSNIMKHFVLIFLLLVLTLAVLIATDKTPNAVADGRLITSPLPPLLLPVARPLEPPPALASLRIAPTEAAPPPPKLQLIDPASGSEIMSEVRTADRADWGSTLLNGPMVQVISEMARPKPVKPVREVASLPDQPPIVPVPTPSVGIPSPNLYLPEGAFDEESAMLTLIRSEMIPRSQPSESGTPAPFKLNFNDRIRPLTRLRNDDDFDWLKFERDGKQWWVQAEFFVRIDPQIRARMPGGDLAIGLEEVDKDSALPPNYAPSDLVALPRDMLIGNPDIRVRKDVAEAIQKMVRAARQDGLTLKVFSGYRDFDRQRDLYLEAIAKNGPKQNGVAEPGYSEHQLGTTIDVSNGDLKYILTQSFGNTPEGKWLRENASTFGFRFSYTRENTSESGYKPEPWHLRYVGVEQAKQAPTGYASAP